MVLAAHRDASYLTEPKVRSGSGEHFFMSNNAANPANSGALLNISQIIKNLMTSAADAEIRALFINLRQAIPAQTTVEEMGHTLPPTPIQTDNTTSLFFVMKNLQPKATNSTDMQHWFMCDLQDRNKLRY